MIVELLQLTGLHHKTPVDRIWLSTVAMTQPSSMNQAANSDDTRNYAGRGIPVIYGGERKIHFGDHPVPMDPRADELKWLASLKSHRTWQRARAACPRGPRAGASASLRWPARAHALDEPGECWWLTPQERSSLRGALLALANWHDEPEQALAARSAWPSPYTDPGR